MPGTATSLHPSYSKASLTILYTRLEERNVLVVGERDRDRETGRDKGQRKLQELELALLL